MYNIPVISKEWNKKILITYTLVYLCKKEKRKINVPSAGKYFKGRLFFAELTPIRGYSVIYYTLKLTSKNKDISHCP